ncbi:MAG: protein kinase, partial [Pirellulales bacterium]|nr:protein kinase [Pirellulales bacterium]
MSGFDDDSSGMIIKIVDQFIKACADGVVDMDEFVPPADDPLRERALLELIKAHMRRCHELRQTVDVDKYVDKWTELSDRQQDIVELLKREYRLNNKQPVAAKVHARLMFLCNQTGSPPIEDMANEILNDALNWTKAEADFDSLGDNGGPLKEYSFFGENDRYFVMEQLGRGGMGAVYLAFDKHLTRHVALKVPIFTIDEDPKGSAYFVGEARKHAKLEMAHICPVYDVGVWGNRYYFTMKRIEGRTLEEIIRRSAPFDDVAKAIQITVPIARALQHMHDAGILHRDVKPANIIVTSDDVPMLMDFGIAEDSAIMALSDDGYGTLLYMAPERLGEEECDERSDIFSLGLVFYEMLTGEYPFCTNKGREILKREILEKNPLSVSEFNPHVGLTLDSICSQAIAKDRIQRFRTAEKYGIALEEYTPPLPPPPPPPPAKKAAMACVVLLLAVFVTYFLWPRRTAAPSMLTADVSESPLAVNLTWQDNSDDENQFDIERKVDTPGAAGVWGFLSTVPSDVEEYRDGSISPAQRYRYRVLAKNRSGSSEYSNEELVDIPGRRVKDNKPIDETATLKVDGPEPSEPPKEIPVLDTPVQTFVDPVRGEEQTGFGHWLAASKNAVVIGAPYARSAYLYSATSGDLVNKFNSDVEGDGFGCAVAIGKDWVVVGADDDDALAENAGAVHVFRRGRAGNGWERTPPIYGEKAGDTFGSALAADDNYFVVGATQADSGSGKVCVYDGNTGKEVIAISNPRGSDGKGSMFGRTLALQGNELLVGAPHDNTDGKDVGIVYVFDIRTLLAHPDR